MSHCIDLRFYTMNRFLLMGFIANRLISISISNRAIFDVVNYTFFNFNFPRNLLLHVSALQFGCLQAFSITLVGTLLIIHVVGNSCRYLLAFIVRNIIADITGLINILAHLYKSWFADIRLTSFALKVSDFFGDDLRNKCADIPCLWLAFSGWNIITRFLSDNLTILPRNLDTMEFVEFATFLLWEGATLLLWSLGTFGFRHR